NPNAVYEIDGGPAEIIKKVPDILKGKPRTASFPKAAGGTADPKFKDKLVVTQYLGRQVYLASPDADDKDIKYGDVLDINGQVTTVIGPLKFDVANVLANKQLYKFLNVPR